jgi:metallo-beta-lactamase family protein
MKLAFHGAAQTVTGSRHLVSLNGHRLLLDCGLFQGPRKESSARNTEFGFDPAAVDAVVLSHAHLDHCGNLPSLVRQGFAGTIHATPATRHIADLLLRDSAEIQQSDAAYLNKKRGQRGDREASHRETPVVPLYTVADADAAVRRFAANVYREPFEPVPGAHVTLVDAGHILGSASVVLDLEEKSRRVRLMFSGDIGRPGMPLLRDPVLPEDVDVLLMECTYGDHDHGSAEQAYADSLDLFRRTADRGGKVVIPAFAVGRTQAIVYGLHQMIERGELPPLPVFVDSPLAADVTDVFRTFADEYDQETREFLRGEPPGSAFGFDRLRYTRNVAESKAINDMRGPLIVIAGSGMAESGRVLHHLKHTIEDPRNAVLLTSWMAPHTLGRRLLEKQPSVRIYGESYEVRAEVVAISGLSAHAGREFLLTYAGAVRGRARQIILVHGEAEPAAALKDGLRRLGFDDVRYPARGDEIDL